MSSDGECVDPEIHSPQKSDFSHFEEDEKVEIEENDNALDLYRRVLEEEKEEEVNPFTISSQDQKQLDEINKKLESIQQQMKDHDTSMVLKKKKKGPEIEDSPERDRESHYIHSTEREDYHQKYNAFSDSERAQRSIHSDHHGRIENIISQSIEEYTKSLSELSQKKVFIPEITNTERRGGSSLSLMDSDDDKQISRKEKKKENHNSLPLIKNTKNTEEKKKESTNPFEYKLQAFNKQADDSLEQLSRYMTQLDKILGQSTPQDKT